MMQFEYFAASNSSGGFVNYYPQLFSRAEHTYIIKGGPGTGKSSFMKKIAFNRESAGDKVEYYYCSSDHTSLDGILIFGKEETWGIIDGTPPHAKEPELPGIKDEIINLGEFWSRERLLSQKNEIISLTGKKSSSYHRAYDYLRCCGNLSATLEPIICGIVNDEKMDSAALRLCESLSIEDGECTVLPLCLEAVGMRGMASLDTFERTADTVYRIGDLYGVGGMFLKKLCLLLSRKHVTLRVAHDPICPQKINGLYIDESKTAFVLSPSRDDVNSGGRAEKYINPKRFVNTEQLRSSRGEIRYAKRLFSESLDAALHALGEARIYHFLLEDIYKKAMDFPALSDFTEKFCRELK